MKELFDTLDVVPLAWVLVGLLALLYVLEIATSHMRSRAHEIELALEYLKGYETGVKHAREGFVLIGPRDDVPDTFANAFRR